MLLVRNLPSFEYDGRFYLMPFLDESAGMANLEFEVMIVRVGMEPEFLQLRNVLVLPLELFFLCLLIAEFPEIHDLTDRRVCIRHDLDEIEAFLARDLQSFTRGHDADLSRFVDNANSSGADLLIHANVVLSLDCLTPMM